MKLSSDFRSVRDSYSLAYFFESDMGATGKKVSGATRYSVCPDCGASSDLSVKVSVRNSKWHCFACDKKGDVIDAAASFFGISLNQAANQLSNNEIPEASKRQVTSCVEPVFDFEAVGAVIDKLLAMQCAPDDKVIAYLLSRGISKGVCDQAISNKLVVTLPSDPTECLRFLLDQVGKVLLQESGIWKKDSKTPAIIYRPLCFISSDRNGIEFRLIGESSVAIAKAIRYGSPSPCVWPGNEHAMITEGFIDMLSAVELGSERTIYAIPGASNWKEKDEWLHDLKDRHVLLCLDSDDAGNAGASKLYSCLTSISAKPKRYLLPDGVKDLNDQLGLML